MKISIVAACGEGSTEMSAFDQALYKAGIANYNLIPLSSVIPPGTEIVVSQDLNMNHQNWGDRLYCVLARDTVTEFDQQAWAGIGWVQTPDGRGLFVEHHAHNEATVRKLIEHSLTDMLEVRSMGDLEIQSVVTGIECVDKPACALVVAVYRSEPW
jgi:arginine decarboxylase